MEELLFGSTSYTPGDGSLITQNGYAPAPDKGSALDLSSWLTPITNAVTAVGGAVAAVNMTHSGQQTAPQGRTVVQSLAGMNVWVLVAGAVGLYFVAKHA